MPVILEEFTFSRGASNKSSKWDTYLDGNIYQLDAEDLGTASITSARAGISSRARKQNLKVRTRITGEEGSESLVVQAYEPDPADAEKSKNGKSKS